MNRASSGFSWWDLGGDSLEVGSWSQKKHFNSTKWKWVITCLLISSGIWRCKFQFTCTKKTRSNILSFFGILVQSLNHVQLFAMPWTAALQASLSFTISQFAHSHVHWVNDESISSSVAPFFVCPQSFPASRSFPTGLLFASGGPSMGASASVLRKNGRSYLYHILDRTKTE